MTAWDVPPRVAVVVSQLGYGGAEKQTVELLKRLKGTQLAPRLVVCLSNDLTPYAAQITDLGYDLQVLSRASSFDLRRAFRLAALLREHRIELVHAVHLLASGYAWFVSQLPGGPTVLPTVRGTEVYPGAVKTRWYRHMFQHSRRILANSHRGAEFIAHHFAAPLERIRVVPNGIDFHALRAISPDFRLRAQLGIGDDAPLVAFVGKLSRVKNVPRFVEVMRRLSKSDPAVHAVLVGRGLDESARRVLLTHELGERMHFLGCRNDVPDVLAQADALVLTSDTEGTPNVVLEALAVGTPVVAADVGDVNVIMSNGQTGVVVRRDDIDGYVSALARLLQNRGLMREGVRTSWPALELAYGMESMVRRTTMVWDELLTAGRGASQSRNDS